MAGLKVKVNSSRSEGAISGGGDTNKILKDILKAMKESNKGAEIERRKSYAGILKSGVGAATGGGGSASTIKQVVKMVPPAVLAGVGSAGAAIGGAIQLVKQARDGKTSYSETTGDDGERLIQKTNEKTGEILQLLTIEEAKRQGIVDKTGELKHQNANINGLFSDIQKIGVDWFKKISETEKTEAAISLVKTDEYNISQEILLLLEKKRNRLAREEGGRMSTSEITSLGRGPLRESVASKIAYEQSFMKDQTESQKVYEKFLEQAPTQKMFLDLSINSRNQ